MQKLNTKKRSFLLLAAVAILAVWSNKASAQTSATATLNIKLDEIQSITVTGTTETLEYSAAANYTGGVTLTVPNHLTVTSTGDFLVKVATSGANFTGTGTNTATIPVGTVSISAALGTTGGGLVAADLTAVASFPLSNTATTLINSATNEEFINGATFNVTYSAAALNTATAEPDTYTTTLTYSITPQ